MGVVSLDNQGWVIALEDAGHPVQEGQFVALCIDLHKPNGRGDLQGAKGKANYL